MFFNRYVFLILAASLFSLLSLFVIIVKLDPVEDQVFALSLFFITLFFSVSGITSLLGYLVRVIFYHDELLLNHFNVSLRQGVLLGFTVAALFGLQILRTLSWWDGLLILGITFLLELYFVARD